jgi:hypothetical protein
MLAQLASVPVFMIAPTPSERKMGGCSRRMMAGAASTSVDRKRGFQGTYRVTYALIHRGICRGRQTMTATFNPVSSANRMGRRQHAN